MDEVQLDARGKPRVQTHFNDESLTVQSDAHHADINKVLDEFARTGTVDSLNQAEHMFRDISEFTDYADAMRHAKQAEADFMTLPSKVREAFNHDVAEWLDAAFDQEKRDELVAKGIIDDNVGSNPEGGAPNVSESGAAGEAPTAGSAGGGEGAA